MSINEIHYQEKSWGYSQLVSTVLYWATVHEYSTFLCFTALWQLRFISLVGKTRCECNNLLFTNIEGSDFFSGIFFFFNTTYFNINQSLLYKLIIFLETFLVQSTPFFRQFHRRFHRHWFSSSRVNSIITQAKKTGGKINFVFGA